MVIITNNPFRDSVMCLMEKTKIDYYTTDLGSSVLSSDMMECLIIKSMKKR